MLKLFRFIWTGSWHEHEWEIIKQGRLTSGEATTGGFYDLRCKSCGWVKGRRI